MQVEYERHGYRSDGEAIQESTEVAWWLRSKLKDGGIESQIEKARNLLVVVAEKWLAENPQRIREVAEAIDCDGFNHRLKSEGES